MELDRLIQERRSYRSLEQTEISRDHIDELAKAAQLTLSCYNNQPWRYVFAHNEKTLENMHEALAKGNEWAKRASLIVAVASKPDLDCQVKGREYYLFDTGMATAIMILKATDMGLVAHPIAGFDEQKTKEILSIPDEYTVITLIIIGKKADHVYEDLSEFQKETEMQRPERKPLHEIARINSFTVD